MLGAALAIVGLLLLAAPVLLAAGAAYALARLAARLVGRGV
jgi:hypothetical protein